MISRTNTLKVFGAIILATGLLTIGALTNGSINNPVTAQPQAQQKFTAKLSGGNGVPPINTPASGVAKFNLSSSGKSISYIVNVANMNSIIGAHIHSGNARQNGPIVLILYGNPTMTNPPTGKVNGMLSKGNATASDLKGPLAGKQMSDLLNLIKTGNAYVNVHTTQNPKGEIRGQIS